MVSLIIGHNYNSYKKNLWLRNGKLRVIGGRKAVHPEISGQAGYRITQKFIPDKFVWDFFYSFSKVPGINKKVPGINWKKRWKKENFIKVDNAKIAKSISAKYFILCDGAGNLWATNF
jgi:hypothetical protein